MVFPSKAKPEGGFRLISVTQLCELWLAYRAKLIKPFHLQVWFASHEMVARRCVALKNRKLISYTDAELHKLTGGGRVAAARTNLTRNGLISWAEGAITFSAPRHFPENRDHLVEMLTHVPNNRRQVPVPRRLLRFLAQGCSRVMLATILGHLFRCLYYREGECRPSGLCKASWIAKVFGVSERAVKTARHRLEAMGFLIRSEIKPWVRNRYGQKMTINLYWEAPPRCVPVAELAPEITPLSQSFAPEITPPDSNIKLLRTEEEKNQKLADYASPGFLTALFTQMREQARNGTASEQPVERVVMQSKSASHTQKHRIIPRPAPSLVAPLLENVLPEDLRDTERLLVLYHQAMETKLLGRSEADQLAFFALAHHVVAYGPTNPGGLFRLLLSRRQFQVITQDEEDAAVRRLKQYRSSRDYLAEVHGDKRCLQRTLKTPCEVDSLRCASILAGRFDSRPMQRSISVGHR